MEIWFTRGTGVVSSSLSCLLRDKKSATILASLRHQCALQTTDARARAASSSSTTTGGSVRLSSEHFRRLFSPSQRQLFPPYYTPAIGVAHFLQEDGVPLRDILECYAELQQTGVNLMAKRDRGGRMRGEDPSKDLRRDFAADYALWGRCALEQFVESRILRGIGLNGPATSMEGAEQVRGRRGRSRDPSAMLKKWFRQLTSRQVLLPDAAVRELFLLGPHLAPSPVSPVQKHGGNLHEKAKGESQGHVLQEQDQPPIGYYRFTPYATLQSVALRPISDCSSLDKRVKLSTFPQLYSLFRQEWDAISPLSMLSHYTSELLVFTTELITHLATALRRMVEEVEAAEPTFAGRYYNRNPFTATNSATMLAEAPIVIFCGSGRLAHELNATGILPRRVVAVRMQAQETVARRSLRMGQQEMTKGNSLLPESDLFRSLVHPNFAHASPTNTGESCSDFPLEVVESIGVALQRHKPVIAVVEPHRGGKDYFTEIRGYFSVRRVLALGQVDGPGMGSTHFPFLSFGVLPGPDTYLLLNNHMQQVAGVSRAKTPMDPPHVLQGYRKVYRDDLSQWLLSPCDTAAVPCQYRALLFERVVYPVPIRPGTAAPRKQEGSPGGEVFSEGKSSNGRVEDEDSAKLPGSGKSTVDGNVDEK